MDISALLGENNIIRKMYCGVMLYFLFQKLLWNCDIV